MNEAIDAHHTSLLVNLSFVMPTPTGLATYAVNLLPELRSLQPLLLSAEPYPEFNWQRIPSDMTPVQGSRGHLKRLLWTQWRIPKIYRSRQSRLLFSPIPEAPLFAGCRFVVTVHDLIPLRYPKRLSPLTPYFQSYIPAVLRQAEHILCNSTATANDVMNYWQIPASKLTPIALAHDHSQFRVLDLPKLNYFLYIGRPDPHKNLARIIQAFAAIAQPEQELYLVGSQDDRYQPVLEQLAAELGISSQVKWLGYVPYADLPRLLNQAIALVFPSLWEGFGIPILEAMACGTPVITSNCSSMPEVAGEAAWLVNPTQVDEIAAAMRSIATNPKVQIQLRQAGLQQAQQFSWQKTGQETRAVLQKLI